MGVFPYSQIGRELPMFRSDYCENLPLYKLFVMKAYLLLVAALVFMGCSKDDPPVENQPPPVAQEPEETRAPTAPDNPTPPDEGAINNLTDLVLSWESSDPDDDAITFDLFFGEDPSSLTLLAENLDTDSFTIKVILGGTSYFWRVVARDDKGGTASSEVFEFRTGETAFEGNVTLGSQEEVEEFGSQGFTAIKGSLFIQSGSAEITSLEPLAGLNNIDGDFYVEGVALTDFKGLESLVRIKDAISVEENNALESLAGLENLSEVGRSINIYLNPALTTIEQLAGLSGTHASSITVSDNPLLQSLEGLRNIQAVNGNLNIRSNHSITDLDGLNSIKTIEGNLEIQLNDQLETLSGLENLIQIGERLRVDRNPFLTQVQLPALESVNRIDILDCFSLRDLAGLENIRELTFFILKDSENISSLEGFPSAVQSLEGLSISKCERLEDFSALSGLTEVSNLFEMYELPSLGSLEGLGGLVSAGEIYLGETAITSMAGLEGVQNLQRLTLFNNFNLESLEGLNNLKEVSSLFEIVQNPRLEKLTGLESLTTVIGRLAIRFNEQLQTLEGLDRLTDISQLIIQDNPAITTLSGLDRIEKLQTLEVLSNIGLETLKGLGMLGSVTGDLIIIQNPSLLDFCELTPLFETEGIGGNYNVYSNGINPTVADMKKGICK